MCYGGNKNLADMVTDHNPLQTFTREEAEPLANAASGRACIARKVSRRQVEVVSQPFTPPLEVVNESLQGRGVGVVRRGVAVLDDDISYKFCGYLRWWWGEGVGRRSRSRRASMFVSLALDHGSCAKISTRLACTTCVSSGCTCCKLLVGEVVDEP